MFGEATISWQTAFLVYLSVCCIMPVFILTVGAVIAFRRGSSFISGMIDPDVDRMQTSYDVLREKYPDKSADDLVQIIIRRQALRCGVVGAITGLGGFVTLPIAIPIDIVVSYRIQGAMVNFIARAYDYDPKILQEEQAVASLVMFGNQRLTTSGMRAATNLALDIGGKTLSKIIPFIGAIIGFVLNAATTQATGHVAAALYSGRAMKPSRWLWWRRPPADDTPTETEQA